MPYAEYGRLLTQAYDLDKPEAPADELARWMKYAGDASGPVLELMCGSGRFLVPLAVAGIEIDGVDASSDMLAACTKRCAKYDVAPALYEQYAHELAVPRRYALAFVAAGSFGLLIDDNEVRATLRALFEHLKPGGVLVVDVETTAALAHGLGLWTGRWWSRPDGGKIVVRQVARYDADTQIEQALGIYELYLDGKLVETELDEWVRRFWDETAFIDELQKAGFIDVRVQAVPVDQNGPPVYLLVEARRPDEVSACQAR